jgi:hypothetical protein
MKKEEQDKRMSQVIAKCWADEGFKKKLVADPVATLKAEGAVLPAGLSIKVVENTDKVFHLVIPPKPADLSLEDLEKVAGGSGPGDELVLRGTTAGVVMPSDWSWSSKTTNVRGL